MEMAFCKARQNLSKARASQKVQYDRSRRAVHYAVGDLVLRRNHVLSDASKGFAASLAPKWSGPYRVTAKLSELVYQLANSLSRKVIGPVHVYDIKPYTLREGGEISEAPRGVALRRDRVPHEAAGDNSSSPRYNLRPRRT